MPCLANSVDQAQLASEEVNWSGSALFVTKYVTFYQLEMRHYDTDAPTQGHNHPHAGILQKMKMIKGP